MSDDDGRKPLTEINRRWAGRALAIGKIAASATRLASRRLLRRADDAVDGVIGERLAHELDAMKGLAMKVGANPELLRRRPSGGDTRSVAQAPAEDAAGRLRNARSCHREGPWAASSELFDEIDETAVAAASIGQVHHAVFRGQRVAVKIQ